MNDDVGTAYDDYGSDGSYCSDGGGGYADYGDQSDGDGDIGGYGDGGGDAYGSGDGEGDAGVGPISLEDAFRNKPQTYEDLCRNHIVSVITMLEFTAIWGVDVVMHCS